MSSCEEVEKMDMIPDNNSNETSQKTEELLDKKGLLCKSETSQKTEELLDKKGVLCKRTEMLLYEENGSSVLGAWNELRSSLRQLHRAIILSSQSKVRPNSLRNRPSDSRIKALSNMLLKHDPHQLFTRVNQLSQELCIELKVRLLATIQEVPDFENSSVFIQGLCESYQWVMNVCEAVQSAFEKLDTEHLALFGLNWITVNMHTYYTTVFTDPDIQDYLALCTHKVSETPAGEETVGCLASLKRTLMVAEGLWIRAEGLLQEYSVQRLALNSHKRVGGDWNRLPTLHCGTECKHEHPPKEGSDCLIPIMPPPSSVSVGNSSPQQCPCRECMSEADSDGVNNPILHVSSSSVSDDSTASILASCDCHYCNATSIPMQSTGGIPVSCGGILPPLTQPQLSLYPHIHGTPSDLMPAQPFEDLNPIGSGAVVSKPPIFTNPYLGSDLLTEQLIREWDMAYGDALSPPGSTHLVTSSDLSKGANTTLVNGLENLCISPQISSSPLGMPSSGGSCISIPPTATTVSVSSTVTVNVLASSTITTNTSTIAPIATALPAVVRNDPRHCVNGGWSESQENGSVCEEAKHELQLNGNSSVITHTKSYAKHDEGCCHPAHSDLCRRSEENSTSRGSTSVGDSSGHEADAWSSSEDSDDFTSDESSPEHQDAHCDCCYCHLLDGKPGGGRQKYSDRRDRLLKILSRKKKANACSSSSSNASTAPPVSAPKAKDQSLDEILNFIEGRQEEGHTNPKKAAKRARQKEKKMAIQIEEPEIKKILPAPVEAEPAPVEAEPEKEEEEEEEEESLDDEDEDGPLAELRRRAPDVTITVVKPGQKQAASRITDRPQVSISRGFGKENAEGNRHPLMSHSMDDQRYSSIKPNTWLPPSRRLPFPGQGGFMSPSLPVASNFPNAAMSTQEGRFLHGSDADRSRQSYNKKSDGDSDSRNSQMVTIRRVMDPISAEPTVTITLKGQEPQEDKVLFKLINGQAVQGSNKNNEQQKTIVYNIPKGMNPGDAKQLKKKLKKERRRQHKDDEIQQEEEKEKMKRLQIQKQQEYLKQQEKHIRQQQAALQRQQEELTRLQQPTQTVKGTKKGQKVANNETKKGTVKSGLVPRSASDIDDMARNFNLPPGVSINKVVGQPGMVTISNNMGGQFPQPFLANPNAYQSSLMPGYPVISNNSQPQFSMYDNASSVGGYTDMYGGRGNSMPWNGSSDRCSGSPQESVIVVDTKVKSVKPKVNKIKKPPIITTPKTTNTTPKTTNTTPKTTNTTPKTTNTTPKTTNPGKKSIGVSVSRFESLTSQEKIETVLRGESDVALLDKSELKMYKRQIYLSKKENKIIMEQQVEEDALMDEMYNISLGKCPTTEAQKKEARENSQSNVSILQKNDRSSQSTKTQKQDAIAKNQTQSNIKLGSKSSQNIQNRKDLGKKPLKTDQLQQSKTQHSQPKLQTKLKQKQTSISQQQSKSQQKQIKSQQQLKGQQELQQKTKPHQQQKTKPQEQQTKPQQQQKTKPQQQHQQKTKPQQQHQQKTKPQQQHQQKTKPQHQQLQAKHQQQPKTKPKDPQLKPQQQPKTKPKNPQPRPQQQPKTKPKDPQLKPQQQQRIKPQQQQQAKPKQQQAKQQQAKAQQQLPISKPHPLQSSAQPVNSQYQPKNSQVKPQQQLGKHEREPTKLHKEPSKPNKQKLVLTEQHQKSQMTNAVSTPKLKNKPGQQKQTSKQVHTNRVSQPLQGAKSRTVPNPHGQVMGYTMGEMGNDARYAQYLAANANTLANVEYSSNNRASRAAVNSSSNYMAGDGKKTNMKSKKRGGKKGSSEDNYENISTAKYHTGGELDDETTERVVESFKRFCFDISPRTSGEKPKVNFNVKDILIKKKH